MRTIRFDRVKIRSSRSPGLSGRKWKKRRMSSKEVLIHFKKFRFSSSNVALIEKNIWWPVLILDPHPSQPLSHFENVANETFCQESCVRAHRSTSDTYTQNTINADLSLFYVQSLWQYVHMNTLCQRFQKAFCLHVIQTYDLPNNAVFHNRGFHFFDWWLCFICYPLHWWTLELSLKQSIWSQATFIT